MPLLRKLHPVGFEELRSNQEVQIRDLVIFSKQCRCEAKLRDDHTLFDSAGCCDTHERLSSAARQDDQSTLSSPITEHLTQTLFLVWSNLGTRLKIDIQVRVGFISSEIVLLQNWVSQVQAFLLHSLDVFVRNLEGVCYFLLVIVFLVECRKDLTLLDRLFVFALFARLTKAIGLLHSSGVLCSGNDQAADLGRH
ncbi:hypothetical protein HG530_003291 [Fusarium avenaceum]|nr:hypothetical protein HG530_003291 [Fusarium avenaceum]